MRRAGEHHWDVLAPGYYGSDHRSRKPRYAVAVEPVGDLGWVETDEPTNRQEGNSASH